MPTPPKRARRMAIAPCQRMLYRPSRYTPFPMHARKHRKAPEVRWAFPGREEVGVIVRGDILRRASRELFSPLFEAQLEMV